MVFEFLLWALSVAFHLYSRWSPRLQTLVRQKDFVAQIRLKDGSRGRWYRFRNGALTSGRGVATESDVTIQFKSAGLGVRLLLQLGAGMFHFGYRVLRRYLEPMAIVNAAKNFAFEVKGDDVLATHFLEMLNTILTHHWHYGVAMPDGTRRYTNNTNGGPLFVYVRDGRIVRMTPIAFGSDDPAPWTITARGQTFSPPHCATASPHALASKSLVYSTARLLHPMKRVDFDPKGARNPQNRGKSGYVQISWDEAMDIVAGEIRRVRREHGPGAIMSSHGSHHTWGNIGYYLSAQLRFLNAIGHTKMVLNPDSWEGWFWGASHHYGNTMRMGGAEPYGQIEDCLQEAEMIVFWSSDPETNGGSYAAFEGTVRRQWARKLGLKMVHIDPHMNSTAAWLGGKWIPIVPGADAALAHAIAYVWIAENLYDQEYVADRTTGFDKYRAYVMGEEDGVPKSPEWQETETGVPAHVARALAREWGRKKTYLSCGGKGTTFGGANRAANGAQWARAMVCLMAMKGLGKPGINFGCMGTGTPLNLDFFFPGYADGGISGDVEFTADAVQNYQRLPHLISMNTVTQKISRLRIPEAILEGSAVGHPADSRSLAGQFARFSYPAAGHSRVRMMYKYGGSHFGTTMESNRLVKALQSPELEFIVNQSIWDEGETRFADVVLPACTNFERWDIGEWSQAGGYAHHNFNQLNHRVIVLQHKCIEPLGESRSDFQIFRDLAARLGLGTYFSEAKTELQWCREVFLSSDLPKYMTWKQLLERGYFVVPPESKPEHRSPVSWRWFAEDRKKDVPEPSPLPSEYGEEYLRGLQTQSGKFEFEPASLKRAGDPERPAVNRYIPSWEGRSTMELYERYPLQLISPHPRFSFHTQTDGKDSIINDIEDHRVLVDGHYYWVARMNPADAAARGIGHRDLVELYNDRGAVICSASLTQRLAPGVISAAESSANYEPIAEAGTSPDRGGCVNTLTPKRHMSAQTSGSAPNSCLIQVRKWAGANA
jgi:molybdopterin guanine dinucleotide-containing S/N-oxide reductase-like protein